MPLPRKAWNKEAPDICVESLTENDTAATQYFSLPEVQYVGSTSGCGCDFPHVMFQNGDWPFFEELEEKDAESEASDRKNREELFRLLMSTGEEAVELYGVWNGDFSTPKAREQNHSRKSSILIFASRSKASTQFPLRTTKPKANR
jgi:hypothetical protein